MVHRLKTNIPILPMACLTFAKVGSAPPLVCATWYPWLKSEQEEQEETEENETCWITTTTRTQNLHKLKKCNLTLAMSPTCPQNKPSAYLARFYYKSEANVQFQTPTYNTFWDMNFYGRTDRKRCIRAHRAIRTGAPPYGNGLMTGDYSWIRGIMDTIKWV